jgi:hypothetical protein
MESSGESTKKDFFARIHLLTRLILFLVCLVVATASTFALGSLKGQTAIMPSTPNSYSARSSCGSSPSVMVEFGAMLGIILGAGSGETSGKFGQKLHCPNHYGVVMGCTQRD